MGSRVGRLVGAHATQARGRTPPARIGEVRACPSNARSILHRGHDCNAFARLVITVQLACAPTDNPALCCAFQSSRCTSSVLSLVMSGFEGRQPSNRYHAPNSRGASRLNARIFLWCDQPPAFTLLHELALRRHATRSGSGVPHCFGHCAGRNGGSKQNFRERGDAIPCFGGQTSGHARETARPRR